MSREEALEGPGPRTPRVPTGVVLGAVEAVFGAGTTVAPMPGLAGGATLLRYLHRLRDPWTNGLHLERAPDADALVEALEAWEAFGRPGRLRWVAGPGTGTDGRLRELAAAHGLVAAARPVLHGAVDATRVPADVGAEVGRVGRDVRDWAGFEVLARWIDLDEDPATWRWRGGRVRNLVQGGRGVAVLARVPSAPVGAAVRLRAPDHRPDADPVVACVVHQAHRGRGVAAALLALAATGHDGPVSVLGDGEGRLVATATRLGLHHVADLVELGSRPGPSLDHGPPDAPGRAADPGSPAAGPAHDWQ